MSINTVPVITRDKSRNADAVAVALPATFEQRWAAWQARGEAHDRAIRRKMSIAAPIVAVIAIALYFLIR